MGSGHWDFRRDCNDLGAIFLHGFYNSVKYDVLLFFGKHGTSHSHIKFPNVQVNKIFDSLNGHYDKNFQNDVNDINFLKYFNSTKMYW